MVSSDRLPVGIVTPLIVTTSIFQGTLIMPTNAQGLIEKIRTLPPERLVEVEDFVDFLRQRDQERALTRAAAAASGPAFAAVWSNPEDDVYDAL